MINIKTPPEPIIRETLDQKQLQNLRSLVKIYGWKTLTISLDDKDNASDTGNAWTHTFYEVYADQRERNEMLNAGYQPRSKNAA